MAAEIEEEEEHTYEVLKKVAEPFYIAASLIAKAIITKREVTALINNGVEVIIMIKDLAWSLRLPMTQSFNVNMLAMIRKLKRFISLCKDVLILVGKIIYKVPVWVIDKLEHGLILGRTYHKVVGLKLEEMEDGSCYAIIFTLDKLGMVR